MINDSIINIWYYQVSPLEIGSQGIKARALDQYMVYFVLYCIIFILL